MRLSDIPQPRVVRMPCWAPGHCPYLQAHRHTGNSPCAEQTGTCPRPVPIQSSTFGEVTTNPVLLGQQMGKVLRDI